MQRLPTDGDDPRLGATVGTAGLLGVGLLLGPFHESVSPALPALLLVLTAIAAGAFGGRRMGAAVGLLAAAVELFAFVTLRSSVIGVIEAVLLVVLFIAVGVAAGWLAQLTEQTEQEVVEAASDLHELSHRLVSVTVERAVLAEEAEDLVERDAQRTSLLNSVSHDLRTPLQAIRSVATDLRDGVHYDTDVQRDLLDTVCDEVERLDQMVANLLSMSRIESGRLEPHPQVIDLPELVEERFRSLGPLFRRVRLRSSFADGPPLLEADYVMLQEVLTNLLGNAARHAPADSDVWVVAEKEVVDADGRRFVQIEVSDQGGGVADDFVPHLFEPFCRGAGSRSTGLGLTICRAMVEANGGTIWHTRTFGGGATFCFTVPVFTPSAVGDGPAPAEVPT